MLRKITDSVTKKVQKQQISTTIASKYIETLDIVCELLENDINVQTLINVMITMKKSNPSLIPLYWTKYVCNDDNIQKQLLIENITIDFWRDTNFKDIFLNVVNRNKWDDLGIVIIDKLQAILRQHYQNNYELKQSIETILKNGRDINKLVILYNNL